MTEPNKVPQAPSTWLLLTEPARGVLNFSTYFLSFPFLPLLPVGDGHPVLVLPGFLTTDNTTMPLRFFLQMRGHRAEPWELGRNLIQYEKLEHQLKDTVKHLYHKYKGRKVSLVGWSAGGVFARVIANEIPQYIRQVITLGSPFRGVHDTTNLQTAIEFITGKASQEVHNLVLERASPTPSMPTTAIYTKLDGIVAWQTCINDFEDDMTENVEVFASHLGLGFDPMTLACVSDRLSQPEGSWQPFRQTLIGATFFK